MLGGSKQQTSFPCGAGADSPRARCWQGWAPSEGSRGGPFLASSSSRSPRVLQGSTLGQAWGGRPSWSLKRSDGKVCPWPSSALPLTLLCSTLDPPLLCPATGAQPLAAARLQHPPGSLRSGPLACGFHPWTCQVLSCLRSMAHGVPFAWRAAFTVHISQTVPSSSSFLPSPSYNLRLQRYLFTECRSSCKMYPSRGRGLFPLSSALRIRCPACVACGRDSKFFAERMNRFPRYEFLSLVFF